MSASAFDSQITGTLLNDPATRALFSDKACVKAMLETEAALARAEAACGVIPQEAAQAISDTCDTLVLDPASLSEGVARDGVPVPALVKALRDAVGPEFGAYVHWGATSQDIVDTGLILRLREVLDGHETLLRALADQLASLSSAHRLTPLAARTRMQQATPTSFGLKTASWLSACLRHLERLPELRKRLEVLSFAGAAGNLSALGDKALEVETAFAAELRLGLSPAPWHTLRDSIDECANWFVLVSDTLGKIGLDVVLMCQNEVAEVRPGAGGGSSTMPNKVNPVGAEMLVALARNNAGLLATLHQASLQEHERSGMGWTLEWLSFPQIACGTGAALATATKLLGELVIKGDAMRATIEATNGLLLAEAASFALAAHMPRPEAQALVKDACKEVTDSGSHLFDVLAKMTDATIDWNALKDPARHMGASPAMIDRVLESYQRLKG